MLNAQYFTKLGISQSGGKTMTSTEKMATSKNTTDLGDEAFSIMGNSDALLYLSGYSRILFTGPY